MAKRIQELAQVIADRYAGDAAAVWTAGDPTARAAETAQGAARLRRAESTYFLGVAGKQYGVTPEGWRAAAGDYGKSGTHMSVADVVDARSLAQVRSHKKQMKAAKTAAPTLRRKVAT
ncbi:hhH-GPD superbase excision DNA repair family protein [Mycobacterium xenopi 4042]|uniref:HhH-GPD superbase excision DNA repair family protein n=1 Tax=Mycobacterium xenopi 4042 TaxID=1299334 RepID=X8DYY0_MYCXE|nr:hhH-GPD superbase excision DNA repair family protein [Mycobacterium xenopi 4042]